MLTQQDIAHIRQALAGEYLASLGHAARGGLRSGELAHLDYLKGLHARLDAAEKVAPAGVVVATEA